MIMNQCKISIKGYIQCHLRGVNGVVRVEIDLKNFLCGARKSGMLEKVGKGKVGKGHGARETREVRGKGCGMRAKIIILHERVYEI